MTNYKPITDNEFELIHKAIHNLEVGKTILIGEKEYPIGKSNNGCKYIQCRGIRFMEQNKDKTSEYAKRAREGEKITWGIRSAKPWMLFDGNKLKRSY